MKIVEHFQEICQKRQIEMAYGPRHWQNLLDARHEEEKAPEKRYLLLFPIRLRGVINNYGTIEGQKVFCRFFYGVRSSKADPSYEYKYDRHIAPLYDEIEEILGELGICSGLRLEGFEQQEVENYLNTNMDGLDVRLELIKA